MHYLKEQTGAATAIGAEVVRMQDLWRDLYNMPPSFRTGGSQWDCLLQDGDAIPIGDLTARVILSPGHTLASVTYLIGDAVFVHDTLFILNGSDVTAASASRHDHQAMSRSQALETRLDQEAPRREHG